MQIERRSKCWRSLIAGAMLGAGLGCSDTLAPGDVKGLYVLQSVGADPLPAMLPTGGSNWQLRLIADTIVLRDDGSGVHVRWSQSFQSGSPEPEPSRWEVELQYRIEGSAIEITFICPPNAMCTAGPHMIARRE